MTDRCETCRFYALRPSPAENECRRFPPVVAGTTGHTVWPTPASSAWCGEYRDATQAAATNDRKPAP